MARIVPIDPPSGNTEKSNNGLQIHESKITYWFIPPEIGALPIPLIQKNILGVVATFTRNGGECWATDTQFGEAFQWSRQKVNAAITGLVANGLLQKQVTRLSNGMTPRRLWLGQRFVPLSPTVTTSKIEPMNLVTHGDYPCHLERLPLSPTVTTLVTHGDTNSNIINKEKDKNAVAVAPYPTNEPLETKSPKPVPHQFIKTELTDQQRNELLKILTTPARIANQDPSVILDKILEDLERWCHASMEKRRFKECWFETLKRQWVGKKIKHLTGKPVKVGRSGLSEKQKATRLEYIWKKIHNLPLMPEKPFNSEIDYQVSALALVSIFGEKFKPEIERKKPDAWTFFKEQFSESYERAVEKIKNEK